MRVRERARIRVRVRVRCSVLGVASRAVLASGGPAVVLGWVVARLVRVRVRGRGRGRR